MTPSSASCPARCTLTSWTCALILTPNRPQPHALDSQIRTNEPLNRLEDRFKHIYHVDPQGMERRRAFMVPPWWKAPKISNADSAKAATLSHNDIVAPGTSLAIYTDGSGING